jgi:Flp pilus assembly protein TadG
MAKRLERKGRVMMRQRLRREQGAAAVEFALIASLLFMLIFGMIGFGVAFMRMQTIRGAVREGGRAAATGATGTQVQSVTYGAATGSIPNQGDIHVSPATGSNPVCTKDNIGQDVTVTYDAHSLPGGGIPVNLIFFNLTLTPTLTAQFRCEV